MSSAAFVASVPAKPASFADHYRKSQRFRTLFAEGMALVDAAAAYLDGPGRAAAKALDHPYSLTYSTESMRLTTRLMQVASWLLQQRSLADGQLTAAQAASDRRRVHLSVSSTLVRSRSFEVLPGGLRCLIEASYQVHNRIYRLDLMFKGEAPVLPWADRPAEVRDTPAHPAFVAARQLRAAARG